MRNNRRGATALEFALIFPLMLTFFLGTVEYAWIYNRSLVLDAATRHAVRVGAHTRNEDVEATAAEAFRAYLADRDPDATVQVSAEVGGLGPDRFLTVKSGRTMGGLSGLIPTPDSIETSYSLHLGSE